MEPAELVEVAGVAPVASDAAVAVATEAEAPSMCLAAAVAPATVAASDGLAAVASFASARSGRACSRAFSLRRSLIVERGFVAVVAVGDHQFLIGHRFVNRVDA